MRRRRRIRTVCEKQHRSLRMWSLSIFALVMLCLLNTCDAQADTQTWNVVTGCNPEFNPVGGCFVPAQMSAVMITTMETGTFYDSEGDFTFTGTVPVVTSITGTFDGLAMTLVPNGTGDWLNNSLPEDVSFSAGGNTFDIWQDAGVFLQENGPPVTEQIGWSAVDPVAESPLLPMALTGVVFVLVLWRKRIA